MNIFVRIWTIIHRCESQQRLGRALMWSKLKKARCSLNHNIKNNCRAADILRDINNDMFFRSIAFSYRHCHHQLRKRKQKQLKMQQKAQNQLKHQSKSLITGFWCAFYLVFVYIVSNWYILCSAYFPSCIFLTVFFSLKFSSSDTYTVEARYTSASAPFIQIWVDDRHSKTLEIS